MYVARENYKQTILPPKYEMPVYVHDFIGGLKKGLLQTMLFINSYQILHSDIIVWNFSFDLISLQIYFDVSYTIVLLQILFIFRNNEISISADAI